jgi:flagellar biosynthesis/type III secretory pathway protein FliH
MHDERSTHLKPEEWVAEIQDEGYRNGYDEGYREGRNDGYQEGIDDSVENLDNEKALTLLRAELNYLELKFAGASDEKVRGFIDGFHEALAVVKAGVR